MNNQRDDVNKVDFTQYKPDEQEIELLERWRHFRPHSDQNRRYIKLNQESKSLARVIIYNCPKSREKSVALTKLEEVRLWANNAIMKNEREPEE